MKLFAPSIVPVSIATSSNLDLSINFVFFFAVVIAVGIAAGNLLVAPRLLYLFFYFTFIICRRLLR